MALALEDIDVSRPELYQEDNWQELFRRLRREAPVHYCRDSAYGPYWSVTRYDDIMKVELDHTTYSSDSARGGIQIINRPLGDELPNFIRMDPPRHTAQRKTVAPIVAPSNLRNMEEIIRSRTQFVLDALPLNTPVDWVQQVSIPLTTMMLATLFDFPWDDREKLTYWSDVAIANFDDPESPVRSFEERMDVLREMGDYFYDLFQLRKEQEPTFDLISMLAHSDATRDMPMPEFMGNIGLLIVGGNDTTRNSMSGAAMFLHDFPETRTQLAANPGLMNSFVAEVIRYQTPVIHMRRTATQDAILSGQQIKAGDKVVMWYISGNFDEDAIDAPETFVIDRPKARRHLSFGAGIHRCVGDRLAEQQLRILWEEIIQRGLKIDVLSPPKRLYSNFIRGIRSLTVQVRT